MRNYRFTCTRDRTNLSTINGQPQTQRLFLTGPGKQRIILGFPWLQEQKPIINWRTGDMKRIRHLTEQRWKNEEERKELQKIPTENSERSLRQWKREKETKELKKIPVEKTKDSQ